MKKHRTKRRDPPPGVWGESIYKVIQRVFLSFETEKKGWEKERRNKNK